MQCQDLTGIKLLSCRVVLLCSLIGIKLIMLIMLLIEKAEDVTEPVFVQYRDPLYSESGHFATASVMTVLVAAGFLLAHVMILCPCER